MADRLQLLEPDVAAGEGDCVSIAGSNMDAESTMDPMCDAVDRVAVEQKGKETERIKETADRLSEFEAIFTTYPPILESLLSQLPTRSLFDLVHTSHHLRDFLSQYPLAWRTLSFRMPQPVVSLTSPGIETPDGFNRPGRQNFLNGFLRNVVLPNASLLTSLDLCNTTVDGMMLCSNVWYPRRYTLKHLSVRGCKNVSIKYHIVPFLQNFSPQCSPWAKEDLALKSLYTYRCRHHRRRPYLPSSLVRRDSDSEPTHDLIELCHMMGIWTDTAWCPTPGGRCHRRKDYHGNRAAPGTHEVWVPFDRLWRSQNRIGLPHDGAKHAANDGRLWECAEEGWEGEPLAGAGLRFTDEGKELPPHLRHSHRLFVEDVKCHHCGDPIAERCETCSVRMHCMGCRKTLCASCAFTKPLPRRRPRIRNFQLLLNGTMNNNAQELPASKRKSREYWWAPGAVRSPNLINEMVEEDSDSESEDNAGPVLLPVPATAADPQTKLNMHWCCIEPIFSGGGGIAFLGPGVPGKCAEKVRATPLPNIARWRDRDFTPSLRPPQERFGFDKLKGKMKNHALYETIVGEDVDILPYLKQDSSESQMQTCPRSLCQDCYRTFRWKVSCRGCKRALCKEHDFRSLKVRKCGYRDLNVEREWIRKRSPQRTLKIPAYRPPNPSPAGSPRPSVEVAAADDGPSTTTPPTLSRDVSQSSTSSNAPAGSDDEDMSLSNVLPPKPTSSTQIPIATPPRHRSQSFSGLRPTRSTSSFVASPIYPTAERTPLPGSPRHPVQWEGCGEYYCQAFRPVGDSRPRCTSGMKCCADCGVWVCPTCVPDDPCPCTACTTQFHCPYCASLPVNEAKCRREAEEQARLLKEERERAAREAEDEKMRNVDLAMDGLREFFESLTIGEETEGWLDI